MNCMGIPVRYDPNAKIISDSRGIWPFKRIMIGPTFFNFDEREKQAILLHEAGHCLLFHLEKRIAHLWLLLWSPADLARYCEAQEYQADRFVSECRYGVDLARAFSKISEDGGALHPGTHSRIARLLACSKG